MDLSKVHSGVKRRKLKKRVARGVGSGHGKTGSRGHKGQYASAGANLPGPIFEGGQMPLFRRIPKRGFSHASWDKHWVIVNVGDLNGFPDGVVIDHDMLKKAGFAKGDHDGVRILAMGEVTKKIVVKAHHFSKAAIEKISAKGGTAELIPPPKKPVRNKMKPRQAKKKDA